MVMGRRAAVAALAASLALVAPAAQAQDPAAAVVPLARAPGEALVALAGDRLLVARHGSRLRLISAPLAGGRRRTLFRSRRRVQRLGNLADLAANPQRAAVLVGELVPGGSRVGRVTVRTGPLDGPFTAFVGAPGGARNWIPYHVRVGENAVGLTEVRGIPEASRHFVYPDGGERVRLRPSERIDQFDLAGSLVAWVERGRDFVVKEWATGAERLRLREDGPIEHFDLAEDGRALLHVLGRGGTFLDLVDPTGTVQKRLTSPSPFVDMDISLAGDHAVYRTRGRFSGDAHIGALNLTTGESRRLSPSSLAIEGADPRPPAVQGDLVAWWANDCAFVARISGPGSPTVPRGPCPRAELLLEDYQPQRLRERTARVRLRCISAPPPGCRGKLRLRLGRRPLGKSRFLIPSRRRRGVQVRLTARALRILQREFASSIFGAARVRVETKLVDGAERSWQRRGELGLRER
jgi:hypothetical protein